MNILIIGDGQVGKEIASTLREAGLSVETTSKNKNNDSLYLDLTEPASIRKAIKKEHDVVINCAAYTDVDGCEINPGLSKICNHTAVKHISNQCKKKGAHLIHFSTDFVFPGIHDMYYYHSQLFKPVNTYGQHKLLSESSALVHGDATVIRLSWVYSHHEGNFLSKVVNNILENKHMTMATDMWGCPTNSTILSEHIRDLLLNCFNIMKSRAQILHVNDRMAMSKYDFAVRIAEIWKEQSGIPMSYDIKKGKMSDFPTKALRPMDVRMAFGGERKITEKMDATCKFYDGVVYSVSKILDRIQSK